MQPSLAVVGAGPGGLYAAREAARLGLQVTVFERTTVGEKINCAEVFFDPLKLLAPPVQGVRCKVREVHFTAKDNFTMDCSRLNLWMIDRQEWQRALLQEVRALGCVVHELRPVAPEELAMLEREYDWVIDASGVTAAALISDSAYGPLPSPEMVREWNREFGLADCRTYCRARAYDN